MDFQSDWQDQYEEFEPEEDLKDFEKCDLSNLQ